MNAIWEINQWNLADEERINADIKKQVVIVWSLIRMIIWYSI